MRHILVLHLMFFVFSYRRPLHFLIAGACPLFTVITCCCLQFSSLGRLLFRIPTHFMMPIYSVHTSAQLDALYPTLRDLYINNEMINVCKMYHTEENCNEGTDFALSGRHRNLHIIFLNASLEPTMRFIINYLIHKYPADDEDADDANNFVDCIMMCPGCGTRFSDQNIRISRSS